MVGATGAAVAGAGVTPPEFESRDGIPLAWVGEGVAAAGTGVGAGVVAEVGAGVAAEVGAGVGALLGAGVGAAVGERVGAGVGARVERMGAAA